MTCASSTRPRVRLQHDIDAALKTYLGREGYAAIPEWVHGNNCHELLSQSHVTQAVVVLTRYLGLCGSAGSVNLYELLGAALLHPETHDELNEVLRRAKEFRVMQPKTGNGLATAEVVG